MYLSHAFNNNMVCPIGHGRLAIQYDLGSADV
jgi:hypothetical protein